MEEQIQPAYMTKPKNLLTPGEFMRAWRAGRFKEGEEVRLKVQPLKIHRGSLLDDTIRAIRAAEGRTCDIARQFELSSVRIHDIRSRKIYKHVADSASDNVQAKQD